MYMTETTGYRALSRLLPNEMMTFAKNLSQDTRLYKPDILLIILMATDTRVRVWRKPN